MKPAQSLGRLTARLLYKLENYYRESRPSLVLGHGDTTSCFGAALSAFYQGIPFFHVEAGLRSGNLMAPYPEELSRRSVAPLAAHHFAPTLLEKENLRASGIADEKISVTGSTIPDAVRLAKEKLRRSRGGKEAPFVLVTLHRREGLRALEATLEEIGGLANRHRALRFVCPVHFNPAVRKSFGALRSHPNISLREPLAYPEFLAALSRSELVITDSGGVQEEAALLGKRTLLARAETERQDGLAEGLVHLAGRDPGNLARLAEELLAKGRPRFRPAAPPKASLAIATRVREAL